MHVNAAATKFSQTKTKCFMKKILFFIATSFAAIKCEIRIVDKIGNLKTYLRVTGNSKRAIKCQ